MYTKIPDQVAAIFTTFSQKIGARFECIIRNEK